MDYPLIIGGQKRQTQARVEVLTGRRNSWP